MMLKKTETEIEKLFRPHLREGEEIRWLGEPLNNDWHFRLETVPMSIAWLIPMLKLIAYLLRWVFVYSLAILALFLFARGISNILSQASENMSIILISLFVLVQTEFLVGIFFVYAAIGLHTIFRNATDIEKPSLSGLPRFWERTYYAITNQHVLIFEQDTLRDYSLLLMADAAIGKPQAGASIIHIYDSTNPTGELPAPIFELKGIEEEEAQAAYELLRQSREEALEDRAREMGIE